MGVSGGKRSHGHGSSVVGSRDCVINENERRLFLVLLRESFAPSLKQNSSAERAKVRAVPSLRKV